MTRWHDLVEPHRGVLFFPVTPFDAAGRVDLDALRAHLRDRLAFEPAAVFVACGTGEFLALGTDEYEAVVRAAVSEVAGQVPVVAGAGYGTTLCLDLLTRAHAAGADGALVLPPPPVHGGQEGFVRHYAAVAEESPLPLVLYQRDHVKFAPSTAARLAECEAVVGLKDGHGDLENLQRIQALVGDRWVYFNGLPTAELSARAFAGLGTTGYSSAVFAFLPELACDFRAALGRGDTDRCLRLLREFYVPFADLRDSGPGYAVALIKAGLRLRGVDVGFVRPPLVDPAPEHEAELARLVQHGLRLVAPASAQTS